MEPEASLVSVIIPVHNCERYLADAIESVLNQDYHPLELIIIDDGSTDGSAEVARRYIPQVQYAYQRQGGAAAARNAGVKIAQGGYLAFLDSDDLWMRNKLSLQMASFDNDHYMDMVFGHVRQFATQESNKDTEASMDHSDDILAGYAPGTMMIRRNSFTSVGPFATNWRLGEFIDWYSKASDQGLRSRMLPEVVMKRRIHTSNMGIRERNQRFEYVRVLKASLDRRRKLQSSQ